MLLCGILTLSGVDLFVACVLGQQNSCPTLWLVPCGFVHATHSLWIWSCSHGFRNLMAVVLPPHPYPVVLGVAVQPVWASPHSWIIAHVFHIPFSSVTEFWPEVMC